MHVFPHPSMCFLVSHFLSLAPLLVVGNLTCNDGDSAAACRDIAKAKVETAISCSLTSALSANYLSAAKHYWNAANEDLTPTCVVFPKSATEVSKIVTLLLKYPNVPFAVKGGGHNPNVGYSSVSQGVLISMSNLASTTISADHSTADIGPGSRWNSVMETLDPYGKAVVGGRLGDVGVGGYLLGGGLSFLSTQYGLACDNVINYEMVLADASIINVNSSSNADLFWALKGGGNQFGIVTKYTMKTHTIRQVWGGIRTYLAVHSKAILAAVHDFTTDYPDIKAAIIVTAELSLPILIEPVVDVFAVFFFYDGPIPPAAVFSQFDRVPHLTDTTKTQSYPSLLNANDVTSIYGLRYNFRATTYPNLPAPSGTDLYNYLYNDWKAHVDPAILALGFIFTFSFQPMPYIIPALSQVAGGNALSQDPSTGDHMWMIYAESWELSLDDRTADSLARAIADAGVAYAQKTYAGEQNTHFVAGHLELDKYNPIFMNDAMYDQSPLQSYGSAAYERLKAIHGLVDPNGFFATRQGGFKFT